MADLTDDRDAGKIERGSFASWLTHSTSSRMARGNYGSVEAMFTACGACG